MLQYASANFNVLKELSYKIKNRLNSGNPLFKRFLFFYDFELGLLILLCEDRVSCFSVFAKYLPEDRADNCAS